MDITPSDIAQSSRRLMQDVWNHAYFSVARHKVQWICEESGVTYNYPVAEVVGTVQCDGCGKYHRLKPGKLSQEDLDSIEKIKKEALENPYVYDIVEQVAAKDSKIVHHIDTFHQTFGMTSSHDE